MCIRCAEASAPEREIGAHRGSAGDLTGSLSRDTLESAFFAEMNISPRFLATLALLALPGAARAGESDTAALQVHGFVSPGWIYSTHRNDYLADSAGRGSFEFSEVGVNFTQPIGDDLRIGVQLFARKLGSEGAYSAKADWYYLDYRWKDWLGVRGGRVKVPFGLYNDTSDIDAARVPVLLPQSVYPTVNRDFLLAQTGGELYGYRTIGPVGALDYRAYYGTIFLQVTNSPSSPFQVSKLSVPYILGGRILWETPVSGLRAGGSLQALKLDTTLAVTTPAPATADVQIPALLWVGSVEYAAHELTASAEYSRWHTKVTSSNPAVFPESEGESERAYGMFAWRLASWIQPGIYYSLYYPDTRKRAGRENHQHDVAATVRFDVNPHWLIKVEGHVLDGTADLDPALNGRPREQLAEQWGLLLLKTTAYF